MKRAMHWERTNRDEDEDDDIRYSAKKIAGVGIGGRREFIFKSNCRNDCQ